MRNYINSVSIRSYRGIRELKINDIGDINIFVGDNNTGKTSVLEAIRLICEPTVYNLLRISQQRDSIATVGNYRLNLVESLEYTFNKSAGAKNRNDLSMRIDATRMDEHGSFTVTGSIVKQMLVQNVDLVKEKGLTYNGLSLDINDNEMDCFIGRLDSDFPSAEYHERMEINDLSSFYKSTSDDDSLIKNQFVQAFSHVFSNSFNNIIKNISYKGKAIELLKFFDDDIIDLRYVKEGIRYIPVIENKRKGMLPLTAYGDGIKKVLGILEAIISSENGVVLIDEFETSIHTSAMKKSFAFILNAAEKMHVQLFMTTHSLEALDAMLEATDTPLGNVRIIRLKNENDMTYARVLNGTEAKHDRETYDMELRI